MFPLGITPYFIGGLLVGLGVGLIYIFTGLHATLSSFFTTTLFWFSERAHFQKEKNLQIFCFNFSLFFFNNIW